MSGHNRIDPVSVPSVLEDAVNMFDDIDFETLRACVRGQEGRLDKNPRCAAIILAGGSGERFGAAQGKQLVEIAGKPMLTWSAGAFDAVGDVGLIVVVVPEERAEEYYAKAIEPFPFVTPVIFAPAGSIRQESAFSGLEYVPEDFDFVVLHDGARPLISADLIVHAVNTLKGNIDADGAIVAHPSVDTLKIVEDGAIVGTPDRSVFWNAQTPQVFRTGIYRRAHASALSDGFVGTDDSSLIERLGGRVLVVEGKRDNIKLTVPEDYMMLAAAVRALAQKEEADQKAAADQREGGGRDAAAGSSGDAAATAGAAAAPGMGTPTVEQADEEMRRCAQALANENASKA